MEAPDQFKHRLIIDSQLEHPLPILPIVQTDYTFHEATKNFHHQLVF